ncbi:uncharacterized protein LOC111890823 [Lactuca sativa]|uniref:Uncharacterized protein n=1 Tax=Lactuca sativa TaxID=4236 RepID=A0A9R1X1T3_LACSA|nr:uncharacterized protein LOC111890823 [Lactuca sativa]KAJ0195981.1 hypothetical protein LSAT_V11C700382980 [Lactuca sativa]
MKISSRSILSPARAGAARDPPPLSLSNSHSRRLRNSRSIKGGASPAMFPATGKKRGSGFENPEPSSPKVTCIGQVRVKSKKKHAKNLRSLSRRRSAGEVSFRRLEHSGNGFGSQSQNLGSNQECLPLQRNNQRWVHLPLTICEGLRAFGSEVSCLFPCRSSCSSTTAMEKEEKMVGENRQGSCGAGFARWLVALQEGDGSGRDTGGSGGGGERDVELVAGDDDDENEEIDEIGIKNSRRHVFQDLEIVNDSVLGTIDEARVSTCVPPKNALLLMRCRSDPMKMEALTNRFWEPNMEKNEEEEEDEDEESFRNEEKIEESVIPENLQQEEEETHMGLIEVSNQEHDHLQAKAIDQEKTEKNLELEMEKKVQEEEVETNPDMETKQSIEEEEEEEEDNQEQSIKTNEEEEEEEEEGSMYLWSLFEENTDQNQEYEETEEEEEVHSEMEDAQEQLSEDEDIEETAACESNSEFEEENEEINKSKSLPECLLLMMYEPKLSMEVSKETWVCSTDFIRRHSGRKPPPVPPPIKPIAGEDESKCQPVLQQPARSSCSSMATKFDQKLVNTNGFEPLILTRCKSEPMKLAPESCFWKNKLEPPRRASFGIDVAGFGF